MKTSYLKAHPFGSCYLKWMPDLDPMHLGTPEFPKQVWFHYGTAFKQKLHSIPFHLISHYLVLN